MTGAATDSDVFDFGAHSAKAADRYRSVRPDYELLAEVAKRLLAETLTVSGIRACQRSPETPPSAIT
jgi:hypothetical protein